MTYITKQVTDTNILIVHISNTIDASTELQVQYSPILNGCNNSHFAPVIRNGKPLVVNSNNTPIVLELQGTYRLIPNTQDKEARVQCESITRTVGLGDMGKLGYD